MRSRPATPSLLLVMLLALAPRVASAQQGTKSTSRPASSKSTPSKATTPRPTTAKPTPARPSSVARPTPAAGAPSSAAPDTPRPQRDTLPADARRAAGTVALREGPDGRTLATLAPNTVVTPIVREGGWVRVRLEAWVPERDLLPADTSVTTQLAAADLRADPEAVRGRSVRWDVELLAFQVADALRRDLAPDEPYLLVRGPGEENAMLYLALPPTLVATARALSPLTHLLVTARVRNGRSAPAGIPILDVLSLTPVRR